MFSSTFVFSLSLSWALIARSKLKDSVSQPFLVFSYQWVNAAMPAFSFEIEYSHQFIGTSATLKTPTLLTIGAYLGNHTSKTLMYDCCLFRPANGCSARRLLVEINFLMLKNKITPKKSPKRSLQSKIFYMGYTLKAKKSHGIFKNFFLSLGYSWEQKWFPRTLVG